MLTIPELPRGQPGVYLIRNDVTGRVYIGASRCVRSRLVAHRNGLRNRRHHNSRLQEDYDSGHNFTSSLLAWCGVDELLITEQKFLDHYQAVGDTYHQGVLAHSPNTGRKRADAAKGRQTLELYRGKALEAFAHKRATDREFAARMRRVSRNNLQEIRKRPEVEARRKIAAAEAQSKPEVRVARSESMKRAYAEGRRAKPKGQDGFSVEYIPDALVFSSMTEAAAHFGVSLATVHRWVRGKGKYKGSANWRLV